MHFLAFFGVLTVYLLPSLLNCNCLTPSRSLGVAEHVLNREPERGGFVVAA